MAALFFYFAKFTSHIMRETTAVKSEDPEEGTIREKNNNESYGRG